MKIFYYAHLDLSGGGSIGSIRHVVEIVNRLTDRGHRITLFVPEPEGDLPDLDVEKIVTFQESDGYVGFLKGILECSYRMVAEMVDSGSPHCIYSREMLYTFHTALIGKLTGIPHITEINGFQPEEVPADPNYNPRLYPFLIGAQALNYFLSTRLLSVSEETRQKILEFYRVSDDRIVTIRNGVNTDRCRPMDRNQSREATGIEDKVSFVAGFIGYFFPWSGVDDVIRAAPRVLEEYPDARFLIIGSGSWGEDLPALAEQEGVGQEVLFTGEIPWEDVPRYLNCMDVGLTPYRTREGLGDSLKTYEYMACGLPVVVSDVPRVNEVVRHHRCGLVFEPEQADQLADRILELFGNPEQRSSMGERGRQAAVEQYDWSVTVSHTEQLILRHQF